MAKQPPAATFEVLVRCRPFYDNGEGAQQVITCTEASNELTLCYNDQRSYTYRFDKVFGCNTTQEDVFKQCIKLVNEVLNGKNSTIFAYGPTGTGKTYTMSGDIDSRGILLAEAGIIPRCIEYIYEAIKIPNIHAAVKISHLEIYNETLSDLLLTTDNHSKQLRLMEDGSTVVVQGLREELAADAAHALKIFHHSSSKRQTAATKWNDRSSRSHSIFTITVTTKETTQGGEELKIGKLNLVDLAGSEKDQKKDFQSQGTTSSNPVAEPNAPTPFSSKRATGSKTAMKPPAPRSNNSQGDTSSNSAIEPIVPTPIRLQTSNRTGMQPPASTMKKLSQEAGFINQGLLALGRVITALADSQKAHVPYRDSKLTHLLRDAFGPHTSTCVIVTTSTIRDCLDQAYSTLDYAHSLKNAHKRPAVNPKANPVQELKVQLKQLQADNKNKDQALEVAKAEINRLEEEKRNHCQGTQGLGQVGEANEKQAQVVDYLYEVEHQNGENEGELGGIEVSAKGLTSTALQQQDKQNADAATTSMDMDVQTDNMSKEGKISYGTVSQQLLSRFDTAEHLKLVSHKRPTNPELHKQMVANGYDDLGEGASSNSSKRQKIACTEQPPDTVAGGGQGQDITPSQVLGMDVCVPGALTDHTMTKPGYHQVHPATTQPPGGSSPQNPGQQGRMQGEANHQSTPAQPAATEDVAHVDCAAVQMPVETVDTPELDAQQRSHKSETELQQENTVMQQQQLPELQVVGAATHQAPTPQPTELNDEDFFEWLIEQQQGNNKAQPSTSHDQGTVRQHAVLVSEPQVKVLKLVECMATQHCTLLSATMEEQDGKQNSRIVQQSFSLPVLPRQYQVETQPVCNVGDNKDRGLYLATRHGEDMCRQSETVEKVAPQLLSAVQQLEGVSHKRLAVSAADQQIADGNVSESSAASNTSKKQKTSHSESPTASVLDLAISEDRAHNELKLEMGKVEPVASAVPIDTNDCVVWDSLDADAQLPTVSNLQDTGCHQQLVQTEIECQRFLLLAEPPSNMLNADPAALKQLLDRAEAQLHEAAQHRLLGREAELQQEIARQQHMFWQLQQQQQRVQQLHEQVSNYEERLSSAHRDVVDQEDRAEALHQMLKETWNSFENLRQEHAAVIGTRDGLQSQLAASAQQLHAAQQQVAALTAGNNTLITRQQELETSLSNAREARTAAVTTAQQQLISAQSELQKLREDAQVYEKQATAAMEQLLTQKQHLEQENRQLSEANEKQSALVDQVSQLQSQLKEFRATHQKKTVAEAVPLENPSQLVGLLSKLPQDQAAMQAALALSDKDVRACFPFMKAVFEKLEAPTEDGAIVLKGALEAMARCKSGSSDTAATDRARNSKLRQSQDTEEQGARESKKNCKVQLEPYKTISSLPEQVVRVEVTYGRKPELYGLCINLGEVLTSVMKTGRDPEPSALHFVPCLDDSFSIPSRIDVHKTTAFATMGSQARADKWKNITRLRQRWTLPGTSLTWKAGTTLQQMFVDVRDWAMSEKEEQQQEATVKEPKARQREAGMKECNNARVLDNSGKTRVSDNLPQGNVKEPEAFKSRVAGNCEKQADKRHQRRSSMALPAYHDKVCATASLNTNAGGNDTATPSACTAPKPPASQTAAGYVDRLLEHAFKVSQSQPVHSQSFDNGNAPAPQRKLLPNSKPRGVQPHNPGNVPLSGRPATERPQPVPFTHPTQAGGVGPFVKAADENHQPIPSSNMQPAALKANQAKQPDMPRVFATNITNTADNRLQGNPAVSKVAQTLQTTQGVPPPVVKNVEQVNWAKCFSMQD